MGHCSSGRASVSCPIRIPNSGPGPDSSPLTTTRSASLLSNILGSIFLIFGVFALGAYLATSRAGGMGLVGYNLTVLGSTPVPATAGGSQPSRGQKRGRRASRGLRSSRHCPHSRQYCAGANRLAGSSCSGRGHTIGAQGLALRDTTEVESDRAGARRCYRLESHLRADDQPLPHPVYAAVGGLWW